MPTTDPIDDSKLSTAPRLAIAPAWRDPSNGAVYVHRDLAPVTTAWADEEHIGPVLARESFGDVESWVKYVQRFAQAAPYEPLLTWNGAGLSAVLDYHGSAEDPGRAQWTAAQPFIRSEEWRAWMQLADGHAKDQRVAIEALEDRGADIVDPPQADLMALLRSLRTTVNKSATTEIKPDGSARVEFYSDAGVSARGGTIDIPSTFQIAIPVLKGHVNATGQPIKYGLTVRIRTSPTDQAKLLLRFSIPDAERVLENVLADQVKAARELLGDGFTLLRSAG